jgi:hypothetical protein
MLATHLAGADTTVKITMKELEKRGVYPRNFSVYHIAEDGRTILAADEPDFTIKKKGTYQRLWLFKLTSDMKIESARPYPLSIYKIEQANFAPDLKSVVISSKRGSDIHKLNLEDGSLSVIQTHTAGEPGFRIHSDIFSLYLGKLYTVGYFYAGDDVAGEEEMVEIDVNKTGKEAFTSVLELGPIQKQLKGLRIASMLHPQGLFFYSEDKATGWTVQRWNVASGLQKIDEGQRVTGTWGEGPLAAYCIRKTGGSELVLANGQTGEQNILHSGPETMVNPCLAKDGNTVVVASEPTPGKVTYWVARDSDGFKVRKLAEDMPRCTLRLSHDGQVVGMYNGVQGLTLIKLESK